MALISEEEKRRRKLSNEDVIGTSAMEGQFLDATTLALLRRFEEGEFDREELSAAVRSHVSDLLRASHTAITHDAVDAA